MEKVFLRGGLFCCVFAERTNFRKKLEKVLPENLKDDTINSITAGWITAEPRGNKETQLMTGCGKR
ncbi:hypothetical protein [Mitsuokella sp.]|uniref:hypothetical protein n=1 Tax=Mitsuokella sp. TaxID=2049034 RepID=UPI002A839CDD|nr:hypothetical protein [Mitsuokella sp.]